MEEGKSDQVPKEDRETKNHVSSTETETENGGLLIMDDYNKVVVKEKPHGFSDAVAKAILRCLGLEDQSASPPSHGGGGGDCNSSVSSLSLSFSCSTIN